LKKDLLRKLPSVDELLNHAEVKPLLDEYGRDGLVNASRAVLSELRSTISEGDKILSPDDLSPAALIARIAAFLENKSAPSLRAAVNATGIILHTGLGRAMLPKKAVDAVHDVIKGYCTLAADMETGRRGHRDVHLDDLLRELTGAEAATVVNNNAAATVLILNTLAKGREVVVSRGQLVEIGGSFRMPEVMEASGAILKEVGTTNKTHLRDYAAAISENTGAVLRVHQSNYRIVGFAEEPSIEELVQLAGERGVPVIDDLGSGALVDLRQFGLEMEPMVQRSIEAGVDVACFSGDKLIGGPQSGVIVGKHNVVEKIRKNQLARAFRIDKMTIAAMEATLKLFRNRAKLPQEHPTYAMLSLTLEELEERASKVANALQEKVRDAAHLSVIDGASQMGSGSVPTETVPTKLLSVNPLATSPAELAKSLRYHIPPIFARVHKETVLLDFRTIQPSEDASVENALGNLLKNPENQE
jgi:L-seryl-tRNA(Ser) seleniumtransferase